LTCPRNGDLVALQRALDGRHALLQSAARPELARTAANLPGGGFSFVAAPQYWTTSCPQKPPVNVHHIYRPKRARKKPAMALTGQTIITRTEAAIKSWFAKPAAQGLM
jgi:hypothetical protein